jgi:hypothetical protein
MSLSQPPPSLFLPPICLSLSGVHSVELSFSPSLWASRRVFLYEVKQAKSCAAVGGRWHNLSSTLFAAKPFYQAGPDIDPSSGPDIDPSSGPDIDPSSGPDIDPSSGPDIDP